MDNIKGHVILLMGPTGSGKGTLVKCVKQTFPELEFSVSCTTRQKRPNETNGVEYYFISEQEFNEKIKADEFLEWAEFSGHKYGTLKSEIIERLIQGKVVLNEIELQGILQLLPVIPETHRTLVYVEAGDWVDLKTRALARSPISDEHLELRHKRFLEETKMKPYADVVIDNKDGNLEFAKKQFTEVVVNIFNKYKK